MKLSFNIELFIYTLLFSGFNGVGFYLLFQKEMVLTPILLFIISFIIVFAIIKKVNFLSKALNSFFESIKFSDDNLNYGLKTKGSNYKILSNTLKEIKNEFIAEKLENEKNLSFLHSIINGINSGVIVIDNNQKIIFKNNYANKFIKSNVYIHDERNIVSTLINNKKSGSYEDKVITNGKLIKHKITIKELIIEENPYSICLFENIDKNVKEVEQKSWENLIRVLTHEIMNSMTPINSLSHTIKDIVSNSDLKGDDREDIIESVQTIINRSDGLKTFISSYRNMAVLPKPIISEILLENLLQRVSGLLKNQIKEAYIDFKYKIEPVGLKLFADETLLEQVLVNLLINAVDAVKNVEEKKITINTFYNKNMSICIEIIDSGYGIEKENLENIFIPFFTTKKKGSGIGLNLCKQIMNAHNGDILVESDVNKGTKFTLVF